MNNVLLATATATVFLGTLYPLFLDAVGGPSVSVGFPFFNRTFVPLMVPVLLAVAVGPLLAWKRGDLLGALQRLWVAFAAACAVVLVGLYLAGFTPILAVLGLALAAWLAVGALTEWADRVKLFRSRPGETWRRAIHLPRASYGMTLAHFGLAVTVAGIAASAFAVERIELLHPGDTIGIAGFQLHYDGTTREDGPNFTADIASIEVTRDGAPVDGAASRAAVFPAAANDHERDRDPHHADVGSLRRAGRPGRQRRLDHPRLLQAAGAVDLDGRGVHGVRRRRQPERPALAGRRGGAAAAARGASGAGRIS